MGNRNRESWPSPTITGSSRFQSTTPGNVDGLRAAEGSGRGDGDGGLLLGLPAAVGDGFDERGAERPGGCPDLPATWRNSLVDALGQVVALLGDLGLGIERRRVLAQHPSTRAVSAFVTGRSVGSEVGDAVAWSILNLVFFEIIDDGHGGVPPLDRWICPVGTCDASPLGGVRTLFGGDRVTTSRAYPITGRSTWGWLSAFHNATLRDALPPSRGGRGQGSTELRRSSSCELELDESAPLRAAPRSGGRVTASHSVRACPGVGVVAVADDGGRRRRRRRRGARRAWSSTALSP